MHAGIVNLVQIELNEMKKKKEKEKVWVRYMVSRITRGGNISIDENSFRILGRSMSLMRGNEIDWVNQSKWY